MRSAEAAVSHIAHVPAEVARCACTVCAAHTNAITTLRVAGSCHSCAGCDLDPIDGADPVGWEPQAA